MKGDCSLENLSKSWRQVKQKQMLSEEEEGLGCSGEWVTDWVKMSGWRDS